MDRDSIVAQTRGTLLLLVLLSGLQVSSLYSARETTPPSTTENSMPRATVNCPDMQGQDRLNSFLWTVKRTVPSYFFGTIHVPYTRVWNYVPQNAKTAFERADSVYFELDLLDHNTISALNQCQLLPRGELLIDVIPRDLYRRLKRHLAYIKLNMPAWMSADQKGRGMYADYLFDAITGNWERKRPVYVMLMINSLTESDIRSRGTPVLDLYLAQEAERLDKHKGAVELVEEHCIPLNEMNLSQVLFALNYTLWQQETRRTGTSSDVTSFTADDIVYQYNCGDLNLVMFNHNTAQVPYLLNDSLTPADLGTAREIDDYFRRELFYKRNVRIVERIDRLMQENTETTFFFALGAGHFIGNDSIIDLLQQKHYDIVHTPSSELISNSDISKHKLPHPHQSPAAPSDGQTASNDHTGHHGNNRHRHRPNVRQERQRTIHWTSVVNGLGGTVTDSNHLKRSQFSDLWVRLESTSYDSDTFLEQQKQQMALTALKSPLPAVENTACRVPATSCFQFLIIVTVVVVLSSRPTIVYTLFPWTTKHFIDSSSH